MTLPTPEQQQIIEVQNRPVKVQYDVDDKRLSDFVRRFPSVEQHAEVNLTVRRGQDGLTIIWQQGDGKPLSLQPQLSTQLTSLKSYPAAKRGAFNQALGRKTNTVLDATGGWGQDALMMAMQGLQVTTVERHPLMALILADAFEQLQRFNRFSGSGLKIPTIFEADSLDLDAADFHAYDCVYLDPMFPAKRKKSAMPPKRMQFLQWLLADEQDANDLARYALESGARRVVVKRPDYAEPLFDNPDQQFSSKLLHYDVYLAS